MACLPFAERTVGRDGRGCAGMSIELGEGQGRQASQRVVDM